MFKARTASAALFLMSAAPMAFAQQGPGASAAPMPEGLPREAEATPAEQQPNPADGQQSQDEAEGEEILVVASKSRESVVSDIKPETVLNPADIRAYGASSLADLLQQLSPQTRSGRGRGGEAPVVLINGKRVSGFAEIRNIPPEAIQRVEVLPEETALAYGYRADQRVVNFILRDRFQAFTGEVELGGPTSGGRREVELDGNVLRVSGDSRFLLDMEITQSSRLLESARNITPTELARPYAVQGNIVAPVDGEEIDPALSALAGETVTVAGVPASAASAPPTLPEFAETANSPNVTGQGRARTLLPQSFQASAGASIARPLNDRVQMTLSARVETSSQESRLGLAPTELILPVENPYSPFGTDVRLLGLASAPGPLLNDSDSWSGRLAAALNGDRSGWRWSLTASHDHGQSRNLTDLSINVSDVQARLDANDPDFNPYAPNAVNGPVLRERATSNSDRSLAEAVASGRIADLPAGGLATSFKLGLDHRSLKTSSVFEQTRFDSSLKRTQAQAQASVDIPLTSRRREVLGAIGDVSVNGNVSADHLSDFGELISWGAGLTWRPVEAVQIIGSFTSEEGAPSIQQLGNPLIATPNVRVFDYATGETVEITRIDGGNPELSADARRVWKLGGRVSPIPETDFSLQADYVLSRITGPIAGFPTATAEIEAAFPDRFLRDSEGRLLQIDNRPVNFARSDRSELRWGINFSERLEPSKAELAAIARRREELEKLRKEAEASGKPIPNIPAWMQQRPQGPGGRPGGGGPRGGGGFGEGRLQLSLFHTWRFTDTILIRDGVPELDLLNGSATGSSGGVPRHQLEGRVALNKNGLGGRISANWQSGTDVLVNPGGPPDPADLSFSSLATVNLRLFADLGQRWSLLRKAPWLRGTRISIGVDNLFDDRILVRDAAGQTPVNFQPDLIDPVGRRIEVSLRKLFF